VMKLRAVILVLGVLVLMVSSGCTREGWQMDYGTPAAQFEEGSVLKQGPAFIGRKITVRGVVTRQDLSDTESCKIYLGHSICCDFEAMTRAYAPGDTVFVDGFLVRCEEGEILLQPALGRDPSAPFDPMK
jgi:hypothetical protein